MFASNMATCLATSSRVLSHGRRQIRDKPQSDITKMIPNSLFLNLCCPLFSIPKLGGKLPHVITRTTSSVFINGNSDIATAGAFNSMEFHPERWIVILDALPVEIE
jgi:hypothetical protein